MISFDGPTIKVYCVEENREEEYVTDEEDLDMQGHNK